LKHLRFPNVVGYADSFSEGIQHTLYSPTLYTLYPETLCRLVTFIILPDPELCTLNSILETLNSFSNLFPTAREIGPETGIVKKLHLDCTGTHLYQLCA